MAGGMCGARCALASIPPETVEVCIVAGAGAGAGAGARAALGGFDRGEPGLGPFQSVPEPGELVEQIAVVSDG